MATTRKAILSFLSQRPRESLTIRELAKHLRVKAKRDYQELADQLEILRGRGELAVDRKGRFGYVVTRPERDGRHGRLTGVLSVTRSGTGYVRVEGMAEDILIPADRMGTAFHGDVVAVSPFARPLSRRRSGERPRTEGEIVDVVERTTTAVVGTFRRGPRWTFVVPDDQRIPRDIYVSGEDAGGAQPGDKVLVGLHPWDDPHLNPEGAVLRVLGPAGDPRVEVVSVAHAFGLPLEFPREVEDEAAALPGDIGPGTLAGREDFRALPCITIDPEDAKDFDDAVSLQHLGDGRVRLGVHIADVSHFVSDGSALDREAYRRGTSVYMVNEVIPMLPERLSNDLCSLRPDVDRLTYSVLMDVNEHGTVEEYRIVPGIIHSARRFSYEAVQEIIERGQGDHEDLILPLVRLSTTLSRKRRAKGSIDFDMPEATFVFDEEGLPSGIRAKQRLDAHRLIEECMLLANTTVARHVARSRPDAREKPFIYRVHDTPDPGKIAELARFVKQFGYTLNTGGGVTSRALQKLLESVKGSEVENVINGVALRSMAKAVYSAENIGHFGLGFSQYTHFTSPIRRYPDLVVHRLLREYATGLDETRRTVLAERLPVVSKQSSDRERLAMDAERASVKVMQVEYMKRHVGDEFPGVITGVTHFGLFVELHDLLVEGMIPVRDLADDYYLHDEQHYALKGRSTGRVFRLGDSLRVRVVSVNPEERKINFEPA